MLCKHTCMYIIHSNATHSLTWLVSRTLLYGTTLYASTMPTVPVTGSMLHMTTSEESYHVQLHAQGAPVKAGGTS